MSVPTTDFRDDLDFARSLDQADPLRAFRERFAFPSALLERFGDDLAYLCGNSLGLMPREARSLVEEELDDWAALGVEGHFEAGRPWFNYHERLRAPLARLVGAEPSEVVAMNSLTVNLHLLMVSFYRPEGRRRLIVIEDDAFPSDSHAVRSQLDFHGLDSDADLLRLRPREGERTLREDDVERTLRARGEEIALILLGGVNYATGQLFDLERIARVGRDVGAMVGFDLAHAAGNAPLSLHDWGPDFAAWCSYKYLNAGPGAVAGAFVHERHHGRADPPRFEGWWGHDPKTRFDMGPAFEPAPGVDAWQLSNPPILATAPLLASLSLFDEAGMPRLRAKSEGLTGYLEWLVERIAAESGGAIEIVTPREPSRRGCQLSIRVGGDARGVFASLKGAGVIGDFRSPDLIRLSPAPLYNSFEDVWRAAAALRRLVAEGATKGAPASSAREGAKG